jgi:hypothetical protein
LSVRRPGDLDLVALGAGVAAAALGVAAGTGPILGGIAVGLALGRLVDARTVAHLVLWLCTPLLVWIGSSDGTFLAGTACLAFQAAVTAWRARGRPESPGDLAVALRITLALAAAVTTISLLFFADVYR